MTTKTALLVLATPVDPERTEAFHFLRAYGFLMDCGGSLSSDNATSLHRALSFFQEYYQLPDNGALNVDMLNLMCKPRCGLADIPDRAYSPFSRKWPKTRLTWNFQVFSEELLRTTEAAFALWAASPGGGLAHAFFPTGAVDFASEVHVDDEEPWHVHLNKNPSKYHLLLTLTHEIDHTLGLQHSITHSVTTRSCFHIYPTTSFNIRLSVEDILAIQNLYESHDDGNRPAISATIAASAITVASTVIGFAPTDPSRTDLCALRLLDAVLIINRRLYISNRRNIWLVDLTERRYGMPMTLTEYATFLPNNFTRLSAAYQRPSGDLALFADDKIYLAEYSSFRLKSGWPRSLHSIEFPRNAKINAAIKAHSRRTYAMYDKVTEIDECRMLVVKHTPLEDIFPGILSAITSAFRYIDSNMYFFAKRQFYAFNKFKNIITSAGPFDLRVLGECPTDALL
ncbi:neutrophil collagenase-like [Cataglyphis hispanica]|uniref:neutrophil collagenase-like n=1 Tax=Cataglyphis hispanica TaxID=1086592 RepID=UPI00217FD27F|nr:neutrophil collagenase-like [Cataglyphis hispanica]